MTKEEETNQKVLRRLARRGSASVVHIQPSSLAALSTTTTATMNKNKNSNTNTKSNNTTITSETSKYVLTGSQELAKKANNKEQW